MPDLTHHKWSHHLDGNFHVYLRAKNQLNPTTKSSSMSTFVNFTQNPFLSKKKKKMVTPRDMVGLVNLTTES